MLDISTKIPGLFVTGTDTDVGKTIIAAAIARSLHRAGLRVAVLKPVATGCAHRREGWVSTDAELLAVASETRHPLDLICPNRYADPVAPSVAARRTQRLVDWSAVQRSIDLMTIDADALIVEGVGGVMSPIDASHTVIDLMKCLRLPAVIVARAALGTINHTLLSIEALRSAKIDIAGVVLNRYPMDLASIAEETAAAEIERLGGVPVLAIAPEARIVAPEIGADIQTAIDRVEWRRYLRADR